jgi:hypothetical protein
VLRRIFRPKINERVGGWRKLHNEALHMFYLLDLRENDGEVWTVLIWLRIGTSG